MNKKVPTKTFYHSKFHAPENFKEYPKKEHDMTDFKERKFKTYNEFTRMFDSKPNQFGKRK